MSDTATYIKRLLIPNGKKPQGRKVWSIDLETVWIPFLTATNTTGDSAISTEALGCPLRLAYAKDGSVKFNQNGKPTIRVNKTLSDTIRVIRENFTATLITHYESVIEAYPEDYKAQVELNHKAGEPIALADKEALDKANAERLEKELSELAVITSQPEEVNQSEEVNHTTRRHRKDKELVTA
jgi:hypothetical protein